MKKLLPAIFIIIIIFLSPFAIYNFTFSGKISKNIYLAGINVGGLTPQEAVVKLQKSTKKPEQIKFVGKDDSFTLNTNDINLTYDFGASSLRAYNNTRTGNIFYDEFQRIRLLFSKRDLGLAPNFDSGALSKIVAVVSGQMSKDPIYPKIEIINHKVIVSPGKRGELVDKGNLLANLEKNLAHASDNGIEIPIKTVDPTLTEFQVASADKRAQKYLGKTLNLKFEYQIFTYQDGELAGLLSPKGGFDTDAINSFTSGVSQKIDRDPQEPKFEFNAGKVTTFEPALDGIKLDTKDFTEKLESSLNDIEQGDQKSLSFDIPVSKYPPKIKTGGVNNLGINELIGHGSSTYYHSIASRVHNLALAASKINGTLVAPGDTFSFNNTVGDISESTGYQQAYIISEGKTVLGDGGGVCQVSTTLFRAVLDAGLPVTERQAHAYRVGYYEQNSLPGFDATVYSPSPDFKFKNDTPNYILVEAKANTRNYTLIFDLYGTNDERVATTSKPIVTNVTPAPAPLYQDDPTLPTGTTKQIDFAASGARVTFDYKVTRGGETIINKTFTSNYHPWQAIYLRGTGPSI